MLNSKKKFIQFFIKINIFQVFNLDLSSQELLLPFLPIPLNTERFFLIQCGGGCSGLLE